MNMVKGQGFQAQEKKIYEQYKLVTIPVATTDLTNGDSGQDINGLFNPQEGSGERNRIGRRCTVVSIQVKFFIEEPAATTVTGVAAMIIAQPAQIFIALVQDKQTNNALYSGSELVYSDTGLPDATATGVQCMAPFRNLKHVNRFKVLATRTVRTPEASFSEDTQGNEYHISHTHTTVEPMFLKVRIPILFEGSNGTIADVVNNSFHIIMWTDDVASAPVCHVVSRFRFVE